MEMGKSELKTEKKPFIKRFNTEENYYIYDSNTNHISRVEKPVWDALEFFGEYSDHELKSRLTGSYREETVLKSLDSIRAAQKKMGLFLDSRPKIVRHYFSKEEYKEKLKGNIAHMILGITQQCNYRCNYCIYSGSYENFRAHSRQRMNEEVARKAVDFFFHHSQNIQEPTMGFYGGEPLLELPLIKKTVKYGRERFGDNLAFSMTTNGSMLTSEATRFLKDHNFSLMVSLDGPIEIHDRHRKFLNGKGTYERVYRNLERFRRENEEYFRNNVSIMAVLAPPLDYERLYDYFTGDPLFEGIRVMTSMVSDEAGTFFSRFTAEDLEPKGLDRLYETFKTQLVETGHCEDLFLKALFEKPLLSLYKRKMFKSHGQWHHPRGTCDPGIRRVFVTPGGDLQICERVSESLIIGNLEDGYDIDKIFSILEKYCEPMNRQCLDCWALRLCSSCYASHFTANGFEGTGDLPDCPYKKQSLLESLTNYCSILEKNPNALDYMNNITVR